MEVNMFRRYLDNEITADLCEKWFYFRAQTSGKTTLAVELGKSVTKENTIFKLG